MSRPSKAIATATGARTKDEIKKRMEGESKLRGDDSDLTAPDYLSEPQKQIFNYIVENLKASGVLGGLDVYVLAECSICIDRMQEIETNINKNGLNSQLVTMKEKYTKAFFRYCNELCLSPQSRAKYANTCVQSENNDNPLIKALTSDD